MSLNLKKLFFKSSVFDKNYEKRKWKKNFVIIE